MRRIRRPRRLKRRYVLILADGVSADTDGRVDEGVRKGEGGESQQSAGDLARGKSDVWQ